MPSYSDRLKVPILASMLSMQFLQYYIKLSDVSSRSSIPTKDNIAIKSNEDNTV